MPVNFLKLERNFYIENFWILRHNKILEYSFGFEHLGILPQYKDGGIPKFPMVIWDFSYSWNFKNAWQETWDLKMLGGIMLKKPQHVGFLSGILVKK